MKQTWKEKKILKGQKKINHRKAYHVSEWLFTKGKVLPKAVHFQTYPSYCLGCFGCLFVLCLCFGSLPDYFKLNLGEGMRENSQRKYLKSNEWRVNLPDSESMIIKIRWFGSKYWQEDKWNIMNVAESTQVCIKNSIW